MVDCYSHFENEEITHDLTFMTGDDVTRSAFGVFLIWDDISYTSTLTNAHFSVSLSLSDSSKLYGVCWSPNILFLSRYLKPIPAGVSSCPYMRRMRSLQEKDTLRIRYVF